MGAHERLIVASERSVAVHPRNHQAVDHGVALLGRFELVWRGAPVDLAHGVQRLVAYLALSEPGMTRQHVATTLWPDVRDDRAMADLRSALWRLRRVDPIVVQPHLDQLRLDTDLAIDVWRMAEVARAAVDGPGAVDRDGLQLLADAGDLLPDWGDEWLLIERERLRQLRLHALERLCQDMTARGHFGRAVEAGLAAVAGEPYRESAHHALINAYLAEGNGNEALGLFERYRVTVREELGVEPSRELADLMGRVRHTKPTTAVPR